MENEWKQVLILKMTDRPHFQMATIKISPSKIKPSHMCVGRVTPEPRDGDGPCENGQVRLHQENAILRKARVTTLTREEVESEARGTNCDEADHVISVQGPHRSSAACV